MYLPYLFIPTLYTLSATLASPLNSTHLYLPTTNWPPLPYPSTFSNLRLTITNYGLIARPSLTPVILTDLGYLRRRVLRQTSRFPGPQLTLWSHNVVSMEVLFNETTSIERVARKMSRGEVADVITALGRDMERWGGREVVGVVEREIGRSGVFSEVAEVWVHLARSA